jgi:hypothetical protein
MVLDDLRMGLEAERASRLKNSARSARHDRMAKIGQSQIK